MSASGSINLAGLLTVAGNEDAGVPAALTQVLAQVEVKKNTYTVGPSATFSVPLNLSSGVTEALFIYLYTPARLLVAETTSDGTHPGPVAKGLLGYALWTYYPGEGLAGLSVTNPDPINAVSLSVAVAAAPDGTTVPPFWILPPS